MLIKFVLRLTPSRRRVVTQNARMILVIAVQEAWIGMLPLSNTLKETRLQVLSSSTRLILTGLFLSQRRREAVMVCRGELERPIDVKISYIRSPIVALRA